MKNLTITKLLVIALIFAVLLPVIAFSSYQTLNFNKVVHETAAERISSVLTKKKTEMDSFFEDRVYDARRLLRYISARGYLDSMLSGYWVRHGNQRDNYMLGLLFDFSQFHDLLIIDFSGNVTYTLIRESDLGTNVLKGAYSNTALGRGFRELMRGRTRVITGFDRYAPSKDKIASFLLLPIEINGKMRGAFVLQINYPHFVKILKDTAGLGRSGEIVLAQYDKDEILFTASLKKFPDAAFRKKLPLNGDLAVPMIKALSGKEGTGIHRDYSGKEVFAAWAYIPEIGMGIVAKIDADELFESLYQAIGVNMLILLVIVIAIILLSVWVGRLIVKPMSRMVRSANTISAGEYSHRAKEEGVGELVKLSHAFNEMADALVHAMEDKVRLANAKTDFLANMSHELRTPLNAVLGFARIGKRKSESDEASRYFDDIIQHGNMFLHIVSDILDLSKIDAGKIELTEQDFSIADVVEDCISLFRHVAEEKGIEFHAKTDDIPLYVSGDSIYLKQILNNLLSNAFKFTESGSVILSVGKDDGFYTFRVADTGVGIKAEDAEKLFEEFTRADNTMTRAHGGAGLGLTISRKLAEIMGGNIVMSSEYGRGSEFTVRIPFASAFMASVAKGDGESGEVQSDRLAGLKILVVDDIDVNRLVVEDALVNEGASVLLAESGAEAVSIVGKQGKDIDLVLMDVQMPGMDGLEATGRIHEVIPDIPVVALTAYAFSSDVARCHDAGMVSYLSKPVNDEQMISVIMELTGKDVATEA